MGIVKRIHIRFTVNRMLRDGIDDPLTPKEKRAIKSVLEDRKKFSLLAGMVDGFYVSRPKAERTRANGDFIKWLWSIRYDILAFILEIIDAVG